MVAGSRDDATLDSLDEPTKDEDGSKSSKVESYSEIDELSGKLSGSDKLDKLMRSVLENDNDVIKDGHVISGGMNQGSGAFTPDLLFDQLTKNFKNASKIFGEKFIRELSGYDPAYIDKNAHIPEFKRELKDRIGQSVKGLEDKGFIDKDGQVTTEGIAIATISMVKDELERMNKKGILGERANKIRSIDGLKADYRTYRKGDRYKDFALKQTIKKALRRNHTDIQRSDISVFEREEKESATIVYALDASGSMKGEKLLAAKRAGIALAYKATKKNDSVGCLVFGKDVEAKLHPTKDFLNIVKLITKAHAAKETDIAATIDSSIELFSNAKGVKHLILLTDGLQTIGKDPTSHVLEAVNRATSAGITISVIGLSLDKEGEELSKKIALVGKGKLRLIKDYTDLDILVIEDYYSFTS